ncbi:hypothetical protein GCM10028801_30460 [Nocardioides maradonensis]
MSLTHLPDEAYYIARCLCHEWVLVKVLDAHPCGACGERPEFIGDYDGRTDWGRAV